MYGPKQFWIISLNSSSVESIRVPELSVDIDDHPPVVWFRMEGRLSTGAAVGLTVGGTEWSLLH